MATSRVNDPHFARALAAFTLSFRDIQSTTQNKRPNALSLSALANALSALRVHFHRDPPRPLWDRLADFTAAWPGLPPRSPSPIPVRVSAQVFEAFCQDMERPLAEYRATGVLANVWVVAGLGRDERRNAQVLAWFLDNHGNHGQDSLVLRTLLESLEGRLPAGFPRSSHFQRGYKTYVESCPDGDMTNRVDIEITSDDAFVFLELKIGAPERAGQLDRYYQLAKRRANGQAVGVLYITPGGKRREPVRSEERAHIVEISWADVAKALRRSATVLLVDHPVRHYLNQFATHINAL